MPKQAATSLTLQELEERGLIRLFENEIFRDPLGKIEKQRNKRRVNTHP
jgi:hypothetical protein